MFMRFHRAFRSCKKTRGLTDEKKGLGGINFTMTVSGLQTQCGCIADSKL